MNAARKNQRPEQPRRDEAADAAKVPDRQEEARPDRGAAEAPPHVLWDRLDKWVSGGERNERPVRKLPVAARVAIIFLLSIACWLFLIALIALI
jgi:hypothetical protein